MRRSLRGGAGLASAVGALALLVGSPGDGQVARADPPSTGGVTGPSCVLKGTYPVTKGTQLFDAASGGRVVASFTGTFSPLQMSDVPADPTNGRAKVMTSGGAATLRIDGYASPSNIQTFTTKDVPVAAGHVWISSAHKVKLVKAAPNSLTAELTLAGSQSQTVRGTAPCDAFSLQRGSATVMDVPGDGRGYLMKTSTLDLYDEANGTVIFTLRMQESGGLLFWSTESKAGFVRVKSRGDLAIDAWARSGSLEALKKGEMMDQLIPPQSAVTGAQLALDKPPPLVRAGKEIQVRARRDAKEKPIGAIESGAEVYLMETVAGWTNVLPKSLGLTPAQDGGFWIPSSEAPR